MSTISTRLENLEKKMGGKGKLVVVKGGPAPSDEVVDALVREQGIDPKDLRHTVVVIETFSERREAEVLSVTDCA